MTIWLIIVLVVWLAIGAAAWLWAVWDADDLTLGEVLIIIPMMLLGLITLGIVAFHRLDFDTLFNTVVWRRRK